MSQSRKTARSANVAPLYAAQPHRTPARRRAGALLMGTALSAVIGLGYGRGAYAQAVLSGAQTDTQALTGPGEFVTEDGFSVDTTGTGSGGNAITITTASVETGDTTFSDNYASSITGELNGIFADNDGGGALSITTTGTVTGTTRNAIFANNSSAGTDLTIAANNVYGGLNGIEARQNGTGDLTISASGVVDPSGVYSAIDSRNFGLGNTLIEVTGSLSADAAVIYHYGSAGTGNLNVQLDADIQNTTTFTSVFLNQYSGNIEVTSAGTINGGNGIGAYAGGFTDSGGGSVTITSSSEIVNDGIGIVARSYGDDVTITSSGNIAAGNIGIVALGYGTDSAISITSNGDITTTSSDETVWFGAKYSGINAYNLGSGGIEIEASGNIQSASYGIYADNDGSGALSITTTGTVTGTAEDGIYANNSSAGTDLTIVANTVTGGTDGIDARQYGTGDLSVTTNGSVTAEDGAAIRAFHEGTGDLSVTSYGALTAREVDASRGSTNGLFVEHTGTGALTVTSNGTIDATEGDDGIDTEHEGTGEQIITVNADITADDQAINADHDGSGDLTITVNANLTAGDEGIDIERDPGAPGASGDTFLVVNGDITAQDDNGIEIDHGQGEEIDGLVDIVVTGAILAEDDGIDMDSTASGPTTIAVNDVTGGIHGISVDNDGSGALSITANGAVIGGSGDGIDAYNASSEDLTITIAEGGSVSTSGTDAEDWAIEADAPNGAVIVNNFGTVTGRVNLTNSNTFTNAGTWDLADTTSNFNATGNSLVVNEGLIIAASDGAADEISAIDNLDTFRSNAGSTIRLADGGAGDLLLINGNGTTGAVGNGAGTFVTNGGTIELDVDLSRDDRRDFVGINGNLRLGDAPTALSIAPIGATSAAEATDSVQIVRVGTGNGETSDAGAFVLAGPAEVGALSYDLSLGQCDGTADANWYLCNNGTIGTTGAVFEAMPGVVLNSFARTETLQQRLGARVQGTGATGTLSTQGDADLPVAQSVGPWMRTWGDFADITPDNSSAGTSWEADSWGLEAGIGTILGDHAGGNLVGGVNLRYGATYADLSNPVGTASLNAEGFGMAASLTWFGNDGFYVDGNAAVDFVSIDATSQGGGELLNDHDDVVYSASAEVGKRIELQGGTTLVPQAQLSWGKMRDGSLTDNLGNVVSFADRETLTSRVGLTVEQDVTGSSWGAGKVFGFGNVLHDLEGSRTATVGGTDVTQSGTGDWLELGGGFSLQPTANSNLFGQVSYREAFNGVDGDAIAVSAGWRMQW